jgi:hypothetical protein
VSGGSDLLKKIRGRGHWRVTIRPMSFSDRKIEDIQALLPIMQQAGVRLRGWDYPHVHPEDVSTHLNFIEEATDWEHYVETWRLYQSGQFIHYAGFFDDWRDQSNLWPPTVKWKEGFWLGIGATIYRFTEVFEFAARLAQTAVGDERMGVRIDTVGIAGRHFYVDNPRRLNAPQDRRAEIDSFPFELELSRAELLSDPRNHAIRGCIELFKRCHTRLSEAVLRDWQNEIGRGIAR